MPTVMVTVVAPPHKAVYTGQGRIYTGQARHLLANWGFVFTRSEVRVFSVPCECGPRVVLGSDSRVQVAKGSG